MMGRGSWRGRVVEGRLRGYHVEVRASGEPIPIYVIAVRRPDRPLGGSIEFAVGDDALRAHFIERGLRILWDDSREESNLLDEEDRRETRLGLNRGSSWRPRSLNPSQQG